MEVYHLNCEKIGKLILGLRKEKGLTQRQLANAMNISDKTISKWERGMGCPDISLLRELSKVLSVNIEKILLGDLEPNEADGGNMKNIRFCMCPDCENIMTAMGETDISCCGRKLVPLVPKPADENHQLTVQEIENDFYITFQHEMSKEHYISFIAYVTWDRMLVVKLYPEQNGEVRFPKMHGRKFYYGCSQHGLWVNE